LKKRATRIPDLNLEKFHLLHFANARPHSADHDTQTNDFTRPFHLASSPNLAWADFSLIWYLKIMLEGSSFETAEELQEKVADILMSIPTSTFRAVFEEWKS
jgi:hypothetical protein